MDAKTNISQEMAGQFERDRLDSVDIESQLRVVSGLLRAVVHSYGGRIELSRSDLGTGEQWSLIMDGDGDGGLVLKLEGYKASSKRERLT